MIKINYNSVKEKPVKEAKHCFIYRGPKMKQIKKALGREYQNLCLKVFFDQDKDGNWGDDPKGENPRHNTTIKEATQIQNICWYHGLAPRVYQALKVEWTGQYIRGSKTKKGLKKICDAQVTDDLGDDLGTTEECKAIYGKIEKLGREYGFESNEKEYKGADIISGRFVDFQTFNLSKDYKQKIADKYREYGTYGKKYYHNVPELGLTGGPRENENRVKWLGLDKIDFKGKSYADLGCANGWFTRYAEERGAKRVHGFDTKKDAIKDPLLSSWLIANIEDRYNIDYYEKDLGDYNKIDYGQPLEEIVTGSTFKYDIVTLLSMTFHIGVPLYLDDLVSDGLVIVEDNSKDRDAKEKLEKLFSRIEHKGFTEDRNNSHLPIYYCYK